jgi:hypothetical protein
VIKTPKPSFLPAKFREKISFRIQKFLKDAFVFENSSDRWQSKKLHMQGAKNLMSEAYLQGMPQR